jgi:hypothetical protein
MENVAILQDHVEGVGLVLDGWRVLEVESLSSLNLVDEFLNVRIIHRHTSTGTNSSSVIVF